MEVAFLAPIGNAAQAVSVPKQTMQLPGGQQPAAGFGVKMAAVASCTAAAVGLASSRKRSKTAARYTTQTILPSLAWIKTGVKASELQPKQLKALTLAGNDVLIGKTEAGALFCVGNLCPHIGTPMSEGADVIGDVIVCPLHGSSFKVTTGELLDWCVSPPVIGPLTGLIVEKKNLLVFEVRQGGLLGTGDVEVLVDTNAKKAYEAWYWKGLLDAQGKDDGTYY
ncbi:daf-36 [Symbiodinium sp. CCMP2592]|nr:daf-36 [Symbiodinium sp. CCMP2592]